MRRRFVRRLTATLLAAAYASPASSASAATAADCFDAEVSAAIVRQTPTVIPECDDCIIVSWPWIVDLDVRRVHQGRAVPGLMTVLSVQHSYYRTDLGTRRWWLRRNTSGGFNLAQPDEGETLPRCPASAPAARPYIRPADSRTLDDLRREGEERYGRDPND